MTDPVQKYVKSIEWLREYFSGMDGLFSGDLVMGIRDWDDAVCIGFGGKKLLLSVDGPYAKRLVLKSALIHASTDVVVKGGRPLFALDALIGPEADIKEMADGLRRQAEAMRIPILGGNTLALEDAEPRCTIAVIGELLLSEPIRDSGAREGDVLALVGEPIWGSLEERIPKAEKLFTLWHEAIEKIGIHAAKDVTKGGLVSVLHEMSEKSKKRFELEKGIPYSLNRNLDNFLVSVSDFEGLARLCKKRDCPLVRIGRVL